MDSLNGVESLGFSLPSPAYLAGAILFSLIGFAAYRYGKTTARPRVKWIGVVLMFYAYAIPQTWLLFLVGLMLCAGIYWFHD